MLEASGSPAQPSPAANGSGIRSAPPGDRWPFRAAAGVVIAGLLATAALVAISAVLHRDNDRRLLGLRAHDIGAVLTEALPGVQIPLASAAALAEATDGSPTRFAQFIAPYVGPLGSPHPFVSASLWRVSDPAAGPVALVGAAPALTGPAARANGFIMQSAEAHQLSVLGLLGSATPRLGYGFSGAGTMGRYVAYAEAALPSHRYAAAQRGSAFADLDYALYLGSARRSANLLLTSVRRLPLPGRVATTSVPFGTAALTVAVAARGSLSGSLPQALPWAIGVVGTLLSLAAAAVTIRLIVRRRHAEELAGRLEQVADENRRLYTEQRGIAQTLQHALLPQHMPRRPGIEVAVRYEAGAAGVDIGGDWYDLIESADEHLLLVVGDVSGRGLPAATTMAALRYAIHAYAAQGDAPAVILHKLSRLLSVREHGQLATVLCASIDVRGRQLTISSAGHLPALLIGGSESRFLEGPVGPPIGVASATEYPTMTFSVPQGATLLAFTDGLVERRGESIDTGLERLRAQAANGHETLEALLSGIIEALRSDGAWDDTALAGIRWSD